MRGKLKYMNKPFRRLPLKQRAILILHMAGFTYKELQRLGVANPNTISRAIQKGYDENYL